MKNIILVFIGALVIFLGVTVAYKKLNSVSRVENLPKIINKPISVEEKNTTSGGLYKDLEIDHRDLKNSKPSEETLKNWTGLYTEDFARYPSDWSVFGENYFFSFSKNIFEENGSTNAGVQLYFHNSEKSLEDFIQDYSKNSSKMFPEEEKSQFKINDYDVIAYPDVAFMKKNARVIVVTIGVMVSGAAIDDPTTQDLITTALQIVNTFK